MKDLEIPGYEDKIPEKINMSEVVDYLNDALILYGPLCDWCVHFDHACQICEKKHRPRHYSLKFGPIESWTIRKDCKDFEPQDDDNEDEEIKRQLRNRLNCNAQTYGS